MVAGKRPERRVPIVSPSFQHISSGGHEGGKEGETKNGRRDGKVMQMQREGKNMADVRKDLGVMSVRWKIEKGSTM